MSDQPGAEQVGGAEIPISAVAEAFAAHPDVEVLVFPRPADGRYSHIAPDVVGILDEAGLAADYATDPLEAGTYTYKSIDVDLGAIVGIASTAGHLIGLVGGIVELVRFFLRQPGRKVIVDIGRKRGDDVDWVHIEAQGSPDDGAAVVREVMKAFDDSGPDDRE